jgi:uncharacterized protein (TIGR02246 family)
MSPRLRWPAYTLIGVALLLGGAAASSHFAWFAQAQDPPRANGAPDPDLEAIKQIADKYTKAFEAQDAAALAALFTEEAEFVDGAHNVVHGRKAIEEAFAAHFKEHPKNKLVVDMDVVRRLSSTSIVEEGNYRFIDDADPKRAGTDHSKYVMLHIKHNDGWRIASIRCDKDADVSKHDRLKQLEWLIGSWVDEGASEVITSTWKWSEDGNYLLGDFKVESKGQLMMKGTQRLGWDGARNQIRSWAFDSEGGFAEGFWHKVSPDHWLVKSSGTSSDGDSASQTVTYMRKSNESFLLMMRDRVEGDEVLPDITVTIIRTAPGPKN